MKFHRTEKNTSKNWSLNVADTKITMKALHHSTTTKFKKPNKSDLWMGEYYYPAGTHRILDHDSWSSMVERAREMGSNKLEVKMVKASEYFTHDE